MFDNQFFLEANTQYKLESLIDGSVSWYGKDDMGESLLKQKECDLFLANQALKAITPRQH